MKTLLLVPAGIAILLCGCAAKPEVKAQASPIKAVATLEQVMHGMVIPNADVVWKASGWVYTASGVEERKPKNEDEWIAVEASATTLTEAGNLLMMEGRAKDGAKWIEYSTALREAGAAVHKAAVAKDVEGVFTQGGVLFEACQGCHFAYRFEKDPNTIRTH